MFALGLEGVWCLVVGGRLSAELHRGLLAGLEDAEVGKGSREGAPDGGEPVGGSAWAAAWGAGERGEGPGQGLASRVRGWELGPESRGGGRSGEAGRAARLAQLSVYESVAGFTRKVMYWGESHITYH